MLKSTNGALGSRNKVLWRVRCFGCKILMNAKFLVLIGRVKKC